MTAAIILAGAHVWSDDDLSAIAPRLLLPVANTPLVEHILAWLGRAAVRRVVFCHNDVAGNLWDTLGTGADTGFEFYYCIDREPRGPAGCCRDASHVVRAARYVVVEGSILPRFELADALAQHLRSRASATVVVTPDVQSRSSDDQWSPVGVYIFEVGALADVPAAGFQDIKEMLLPRLHRQNERVLTHITDRVYPRISGIEEYFAVHAYMLSQICAGGAMPAGYLRTNGTCRHSTALMGASVDVVGPVMLGPGSRVERGVALIGPTVLGRNCLIEQGCVVQRSILWHDCALGARARVNRCLLVSGRRVDPDASETDSILYEQTAASSR
jgi:NDP-sugar pyrophosphorylase family protein